MQKNIFGNKTLKISTGIILFILASTSPSVVFAQDAKKQDTDFDGLSNYVELEEYKTNPTLFDTDSDGIGDSQEILIDKTNPLDANSSVLIDIEQKSRSMLSPGDPLIWYISRIAGIAAFIMFTLVVSMGLLMTSKVLLKVPFIRSPDALKMHSFNATFIAFGLMLIHFISLMFDSYIQLTLIEILVPFTVQRNLTSALGFDFRIPIGIGVIAFYLSVLLVVTSHFRKKLPSIKIWRMIHFSSFLFYVLFVIHGITAGSDTKELWMQLIYVWSILQVSGLILLRIFGKKYFINSLKKVEPSVTVSPSLQITK